MLLAITLFSFCTSFTQEVCCPDTTAPIARYQLTQHDTKATKVVQSFSKLLLLVRMRTKAEKLLFLPTIVKVVLFVKHSLVGGDNIPLAGSMIDQYVDIFKVCVGKLFN